MLPAPPPYFDALLERLAAGDPEATAALGRHVHWGYWANPDAPPCSAAEYGAAAEELCRRVCDAAPVRDGVRVLDVGCGFGGTIASLNERFRALDLTGVNIDARQLERAAATVATLNGNRVAWVEADACALPFAGASFDVVLAVECAFHFPSRARFLAEAGRVLKPGGRLALSDFVPTAEGLEALQKYDGGGSETRDSYGSVNVSCTESEYRGLLEAAGFAAPAFADITAHTLPTYPFIRGVAARWQGNGAAAYIRATRRLEVSSRVGWLRYLILSATRGA